MAAELETAGVFARRTERGLNSRCLEGCIEGPSGLLFEFRYRSREPFS